MATPGDDPFTESESSNKSKLFPMGTDASFHASPIVARPNAPNKEDRAVKIDPTFMQNQISFQRSPSTTKSQASALSGRLSAKSIGSYDGGSHQPSITRVHSSSSPIDEKVSRGRGRGDSDSSIIEATNTCSLSKTSSTSTDRSVQSIKSVRSVHAVGSYPLGSLRVHSPSPTRNVAIDSYECLKSGDVIVVRDIPIGSLFGIDTAGFTIKAEDHFEGIKDLPPGAHFFWGASGAASVRNGFWFMSSKRASDEFGEVHVRRWDKYNETLEEEVSVAEIRIQKEGVPELFDKLKSYMTYQPIALALRNQPHLGSSRSTALDPNIWLRLTSCMKGALLTRITGHGWNHWQVASTHDYKPTIKVNSLLDDPMDYHKDEVLNFIFPRAARTFAETSVGRDRTEQAMDTSAHIMAIITAHCTYEDSDEIIGELQFCYVTGMVLGNVACMEHWAHIVKVIFRAFRLALDLPLFFRKVIEAVHAQLIYDEEGLEGSILDHSPDLSDDLKMILTIFKSRLNEQLLAQGVKLTSEQSAVGKSFEEFESWLWKWGWDLRGNYVRSGKIQLEDGEFVDAELKDFEAEDERGEYAPVLVDLDEDGRDKGLIRL